MPLTKREAEISNKPLRNQAAALAVWNQVQEKLDQSIAWPERTGSDAEYAGTGSRAEQMSTQVTSVRNRASAWEVSSP